MPQIVGKFMKAFPVVSGEKDGKEWCRVQFAIMTLDSNSKMVAFDAFGSDRVAVVQSLQVGQVVMVEYTPESREWNDRFYTNLDCRKVSATQRIDPMQAMQQVQQQQAALQQAAYQQMQAAQMQQPAMPGFPAMPQAQSPMSYQQQLMQAAQQLQQQAAMQQQQAQVQQPQQPMAQQVRMPAVESPFDR